MEKDRIEGDQKFETHPPTPRKEERTEEEQKQRNRKQHKRKQRKNE